jgi:hypothetical protein
VLDAGSDRWLLITRDLRLFEVGTAGPLAAPEPIDLAAGIAGERPFANTAAVLSPDGSRLYIGTSAREETWRSGMADEIWVFDTRSWQRVQRLKLERQASHFALSLDGRRLYAVNRQEATLSAIDVASGQEQVFPGVGTTPAKVIVAPSP